MVHTTLAQESVIVLLDNIDVNDAMIWKEMWLEPPNIYKRTNWGRDLALCWKVG